MLKKAKTSAVSSSHPGKKPAPDAAPLRKAAIEQDFRYDEDDAGETDSEEDTAR